MYPFSMKRCVVPSPSGNAVVRWLRPHYHRYRRCQLRRSVEENGSVLSLAEVSRHLKCEVIVGVWKEGRLIDMLVAVDDFTVSADEPVETKILQVPDPCITSIRNAKRVCVIFI